MTRWLITGGCGFIGLNLIRRLIARSDVSICIADDLSVGSRKDLSKIHSFKERHLGDLSQTALGDIDLVIGDIRNETFAREVTKGADVVVHLAANTGVAPSVLDPRSDCISNVIGTLNFLEACRHHGIKRFVFASSGAPVGECEPPLHEELPTHPVSPYGASKLAGEAYCSAYKRSFGIDTVALRFGNCYGPLSSHKGSIVAKFIREALADEPWNIYGDGSQTRDFIFVEDVADAIISGGTVTNIGGEIFQIATSRETTIRELADHLVAILAKRKIKVPAIRNASARIGDVNRNFSDTRKAHTRLGWSARVSLDEGLERTVDWFLEQKF